MSVDLGQLIASRRFAIPGNPHTDVLVRIGSPRPYDDSPSSSYYCPYQITGVGDGKVKRVGGVDALQALEMALLILPVELEVIARKHPALRWEHAFDSGDFGFSKRLLAATSDPDWGEVLRRG